jgi:hypothetical protein
VDFTVKPGNDSNGKGIDRSDAAESTLTWCPVRP